VKAASAVRYSLLRSGHPPKRHRRTGFCSHVAGPVPLHPGSDVSAPNHNTTQYEPARSTPAMTSKRARDNRGGFPAATRRCQWHMPHSKRAILINAPSFPVRRLVLGGPAAARGLPRFELACTAPHPLLPAAAAQPNSSCKSQSKPHPTAVLIAAYCRTAKRR
jgi:hypothetical protein